MKRRNIAVAHTIACFVCGNEVYVSIIFWGKREKEKIGGSRYLPPDRKPCTIKN